jgi:hypothetical protein
VQSLHFLKYHINFSILVDSRGGKERRKSEREIENKKKLPL